jgi:hypothetical protein
VQVLRNRGLITTVHGRGTFVSYADRALGYARRGRRVLASARTSVQLMRCPIRGKPVFWFFLSVRNWKVQTGTPEFIDDGLNKPGRRANTKRLAVSPMHDKGVRVVSVTDVLDELGWLLGRKYTFPSRNWIGWPRFWLGLAGALVPGRAIRSRESMAGHGTRW